MVFGLYGLSFVKHYLPQNDTVKRLVAANSTFPASGDIALPQGTAVPLATSG